MNEKTLYIHAGGPKTGTTALQNFFEINFHRLEGLGFAYENRVNIKSEYEINSGNGLLLYETLSFKDITDIEIDSLVLSYFGQCNYAICSSECFSKFDARVWRKLLESSVRLCVKVKVIIYVRNFIPFLLSAYDQVIKQDGEWRLFDEWAVQDGFQHASLSKGLQIIAGELPRENIHVLHYDRLSSNLIRSFFDVLGINSSFEVDQNDQRRQVNRSLTNEEREALLTVNKALGNAYSQELSDLLINANPNALGEPIVYHKTTEKLFLAQYNNEVNWLNNAFFNGQSVVSVLPIDLEKTIGKEPIIEPAHNSEVGKQVLNWALEKLKTIQGETENKLLYTLNYAVKNTTGASHSDIPADFDSIVYLLLNRDVLRAGFDPIQHFIIHGKQEGRAYKFLNRQTLR
jgi:hypothetical protein